MGDVEYKFVYFLLKHTVHVSLGFLRLKKAFNLSHLITSSCVMCYIIMYVL